MTMHDVLYVPKMSENPFSVGAALKRGNSVKFKKSRYLRNQHGKLCGIGSLWHDGLFQLDVDGLSAVCHAAPWSHHPAEEPEKFG